MSGRRKITKRYRIVIDHTGGRYGVIDQGKPLIGKWCHCVHGSIGSAMNWVARQRCHPTKERSYTVGE